MANASNLEEAIRCFKERLGPPELRFGALPKSFETLLREIVPETKIYETIQKVGNGSGYTCSDGIPRYRFHGSPTSEITSLATVTSYGPQWVVPRGLQPFKWPTCTVSGDADFCLQARSAYDAWTKRDGFMRLVDSDWHALDQNWWRCPMELCLIDTGEEVVLMYWPPEAPSDDPCAHGVTNLPVDAQPRTVVLSAITFQGQDLYEKKSQARYVRSSVLTGPFTFVSPTIYLAHHDITLASMSSMSWNPTVTWSSYTGNFVQSVTSIILRSGGVIPLSASDIYSMRPKGAVSRSKTNYAQQVAHGNVSWLVSKYWTTVWPDYMLEDSEEIVPFDFSDLPNPVPASIFYDARSEDCWGKQTHCGTITDDSYRPRLAVKAKAWSSLFPEWSNCYHGSLVDPPIALRPLTGPLSQATVTAKPHVPAKETSPTDQGRLLSDPLATARPGHSVVDTRVGPAQPTANIRAGPGLHRKPGIFGELVADDPGGQVGKTRTPAIGLQPDRDGPRGYDSRPGLPKVSSQAYFGGNNPLHVGQGQIIDKNGKVVQGLGRTGSAQPIIFVGHAHSLHLSFVVESLAALVVLVVALQ